VYSIKKDLAFKVNHRGFGRLENLGLKKIGVLCVYVILKNNICICQTPHAPNKTYINEQNRL